MIGWINPLRGKDKRQAKEIAALRHRLRSEAAGLKRAAKIAARTSLVEEMIRHPESRK